MPQITEVGTYRGEVVQTVLKLTKKGHPMAVLELRADEKYVDDTAFLNQLVNDGTIESAEPQWFDCSDAGESVFTNMVLFYADVKNGDQCRRRDPDNPNDENHNETFNVERVENVFGWNGKLSDFSNGVYDGKKCMFRCRENSDPQFKNLDVAYIGGFDEDPARSLQGISVDDAVDFDKLVVGGPKKKVKKASRPKVTPSTTTSGKTSPATTKTTKTSKTKVTPPPAPAPTPEPDTPSSDIDFGDGSDPMTAAWNFVCVKAENEDDDVVADSWGQAIQECQDTAEKTVEDFGQDDWSFVAKTTLSDLAITV